MEVFNPAENSINPFTGKYKLERCTLKSLSFKFRIYKGRERRFGFSREVASSVLALYMQLIFMCPRGVGWASFEAEMYAWLRVRLG